MRKIFVFHTKANLYCSSDDGGKSANFNYHSPVSHPHRTGRTERKETENFSYYSPVRTRTAQLAHIGVATGRHRLRNWRVFRF